VRHPLTNIVLPVVVDGELVDPELGTGVVKITPRKQFEPVV
jgi:valyl-tRNA synthetase